ncbi:hypothetical protein E8E14_007938 [Neopestalotiopsis sp. 37M]|nr:hypothetical protein E8E14_007938 [Neopestalotiopsis sp. 37M]
MSTKEAETQKTGVAELDMEYTPPEKLSLGKKILYHLWDADQHLKSPQERALVRKLDFGILICATLGWWMKYIDQSNIANAYVSGMKEDLNIEANEYTYMLMCYTISFAIVQVPANAIALKIRPRICLVVCEIGWTIFTFAQAAARNSNDMYAFRFMVVCGCMSLPVAVSVWFLLPDYPHNTTAWYITEEDREIAMRRSAYAGKTNVTGKMDLALVKRMFGNWRWWTLCLMYIFYGNSCQANQYFSVYLKSAGYSVALRNVIPACANLVSMATDFFYGMMSDMFQNRSYWMMGPLLCTTAIGSAILTAWPDSDAPKIAAFFLCAGGYVTAVAWTWANEINNGNAEERALTISSMNGLFYATNSFLPILIFPQTTAPRYEKGFPSILAFALIAVVLIFLTDFLHKRQLKQEQVLQAEQPLSEIPKMPDLDEEKEAEKRLASSVAPVQGSVAIM